MPLAVTQRQNVQTLTPGQSGPALTPYRQSHRMPRRSLYDYRLEQLWDKAKQTPIETEIRNRKWGWIGHTLRKPASNITRQALDWNPQGKRKVGRPKQTWRRSTDAEIKAAGTTWAELRRTSQNRVRWRGVVAALCSTRNQEA